MDSIPLAVAYPWTVSEPQAPPRPSNKRQGSGFLYLQQCSWSDSPSVKRIRSLFKLPQPDAAVASSSSTTAAAAAAATATSSSSFSTSKRNFQDPDNYPHNLENNHNHINTTLNTITTTPSSLFLHLLQQIDQVGNGSRSAKDLIQSCALTVRPESTPGNMDARSAILAALMFLSSSGQLSDLSSHDTNATSLRLPLLEMDDKHDADDHDYEDDETRFLSIRLDPEHSSSSSVVYRKAWSWNWTDFQSNSSLLQELQLLWDSSTIRREVFVPRFFLSDLEEIALLQRGIVPASATATSTSGKRNNQSTTNNSNNNKASSGQQSLTRRKLPSSINYGPND
jgi:hypothetical protein